MKAAMEALAMGVAMEDTATRDAMKVATKETD